MEINSTNPDEQHQPVGSTACTGPIPNANSNDSISSNGGDETEGCPPTMPQPLEPESKDKKILWYVLRAAYGTEKQAYDYITENSDPKDVKLFWPKRFVRQTINGRVIDKEEILIPNILFVKASKRILDKFVFDNIHLPYLRYYYHQYHKDDVLVHEPLFVPAKQMTSFMQIYKSNVEGKYIAGDIISKFAKGQLVRVIDGPFKGVVGRVARFKGQQRVGVCVDHFMTAVTTWIKNKYLEVLEEDELHNE